jgi:hypothetical protein
MLLAQCATPSRGQTGCFVSSPHLTKVRAPHIMVLLGRNIRLLPANCPIKSTETLLVIECFKASSALLPTLPQSVSRLAVYTECA